MIPNKDKMLERFDASRRDRSLNDFGSFFDQNYFRFQARDQWAILAETCCRQADNICSPEKYCVSFPFANFEVLYNFFVLLYRLSDLHKNGHLRLSLHDGIHWSSEVFKNLP